METKTKESQTPSSLQLVSFYETLTGTHTHTHTHTHTRTHTHAHTVSSQTIIRVSIVSFFSK